MTKHYCYDLVGYDVHRLDRDEDMLACEWLSEIQLLTDIEVRLETIEPKLRLVTKSY